MSGSSNLVESAITELVLQHLDNEAIGLLLEKAPQKRGISILPVGAKDIIRNKAIQTLLLNKNLKYVVSVIESGQFNGWLKENYEEITIAPQIEEFKGHIKKTNGLAIGYLLYLIEIGEMSKATKLFGGNLIEVKQFSKFLESEGLNDIRLEREKKEPNIDSDVEIRIQELEEENQKLQKKLSRESIKLERQLKNELKALNKENHEKSLKMIEEHEAKVSELKDELETAHLEIKRRISFNKELEVTVTKLKNSLEIERKIKLPIVLVVGNLPENSIIDTTKYRIQTMTTLNMENGCDISSLGLMKIYLQSEYVSTSEYLTMKKNTLIFPLSISAEKI